MSEYRNIDNKIYDTEHYDIHINAMTTEKLYSKVEIAGELAYRDIQIEQQAAEIERLEKIEVLAIEVADNTRDTDCVGNAMKELKVALEGKS